jgi:hypothetical protein
MKMALVPCTIIGMVLWATPGRAESVQLKPGEYQISAVTEASNGEAGKPDVRSRCLKAEHLANPDAVFNYYVTNGFQPNPSSKVLNVEMQGGKVSYDVVGSFARTHVEGTVSGTAFSVVRTASPTSGEGLSVTMKVEGKRTGDCTTK